MFCDDVNLHGRALYAEGYADALSDVHEKETQADTQSPGRAGAAVDPAATDTAAPSDPVDGAAALRAAREAQYTMPEGVITITTMKDGLEVACAKGTPVLLREMIETATTRYAEAVMLIEALQDVHRRNRK